MYESPGRYQHFVSVRNIINERHGELTAFKVQIPDFEASVEDIAQQILVRSQLDIRVGICLKDVKLIYNGSSLSHSRTLADYNITSNSTILFTYPQPIVDPASFLNFASCKTAQEALHAISNAAAASGSCPNPLTLRDSSGKTSLHHACIRFEDASVTRALIAAGTGPNVADSDGFTPLFFAKTKEVALELLMASADPRHVASKQTSVTPLHYAASGDIVDILIAHGCDISPPNAPCIKALHFARNGEVARRLIHHKADVNARSPSGKTPLHCALDVDTAVALLEAKADLHACDNRGHCALHYANTPALARWFVRQGLATHSQSGDRQMSPIETVLTFETAVVFYEAGETFPDPALARRRVCTEKWEPSETNDQRYLEFQRFNDKLVLAGLCRGSSSAVAFGRQNHRVWRLCSSVSVSCLMTLCLSVRAGGGIANCVVSDGMDTDDFATGGGLSRAQGSAASAASARAALPILSVSNLQRLRCLGCATMAGLLVSRLGGATSRRCAEACVCRVGSSALGLKLHFT